jgi:hypothetical protein
VRRLALLAAVAALLATFGACDDQRVRVTFRPDDGARYRYEIRVESTSDLELEGRPPEHRDDDVVLHASHRVLSVGDEGSRVEVVLRPRDDPSTSRTFQVRFDRAAQLSEVQRIEGLPADVLGELGLSEIFPAAAGAPPDRAIGPGDGWDIDEPLQLPGLRETRLRGKGRLVQLGVVGGHDVATVTSRTELPVTRRSGSGQGEVELRGTQHTRSTASHRLSDGSVERADAVTTGDFRLRLLPPDGDETVALGGRLRVRVHTVTRRLR